MKRLLLITFFWAVVLQINAQEYPKVILSGDYPDPTILRDGKDYYMTHSPFYYAPGFLIWHSRDLMNWRPICRALAEWKGSAMAPDLVKCNDKYYIYYPAAGTNWVIWANDIRGPWSKPVDLKVKGIDPGHLQAQDGKRYLFLSDGYAVPLTDDGLATVGTPQKMYDGWVYPKEWETECMCLESPKLSYYNGYYYLTSAQGGTAGPATSHMVVTARSKNPMGPWENSPYNPLVHTYSDKDNWWSKGHGTLVDDADGNWWVIYHAYARGYHTLGRQTLIEPIEWTKDGWYRPKALGVLAKTGHQPGNTLPLSDDFRKPELGLQWTFWKEYVPEALAFKDGMMEVKGKGTTVADSRLLLVTATDKNYEVQVEVNVGRSNTAGLLLFYREKAFAGIVSDGRKFIIYKDADSRMEVPNRIGRTFVARLHNHGNLVDVSVSKDGKEWTLLADNIDVKDMNHNKHMGFYALRPALVSAGKGVAGFRQFCYRNGVPQEKDMAAYLMVFHKDDTHSLHMAVSRDGYSFTALNDGEPVIAGDTIAHQKGIRDPHIYRGPDGAFYMAMTDLHAFGQKAGYRTTKWERDEVKHGWGNNRGFVLMKSWDLVNWKHTCVRFDSLSDAYKEMSVAWAPETIYDEEAGKLMIYYSMNFGNELKKLYYVYVNEDFDRLESIPQVLFTYPNERCSAIDADITKVGDKYIMFYKTNDGELGIKQAISDRANGGYEFNPRFYDTTSYACEGPNVWKRNGQDCWVLMYDIYGRKKHNFGFIETSDFVNFTDLGEFNEGVMKATNFTAPKHGAIIQITKDEADRLEKHWQTKQ